MFVKDVVMDGFKCYAERTAIRNLDRNFTAITGLNGSGKSNIIDAVVFALDLSSSRLMRAASLKELINIHRKECSVQLVFDNSDKARSPAGYEHHDAIEVARMLDHEGKSKYRINGHSCTRGTVEKMARSVGISIDFVVLQGRITKVLNMKSGELRGMVEEVAGTRSYNEEKERAVEELGRKEAKLREAQEYLRRSVSPYMSEVLKEKKIYEENRDFDARRKVAAAELAECEAAKQQHEHAEALTALEGFLSEYVADKAELDEIEAQLAAVDEMRGAADVVELKSAINAERLRLEDVRARASPDELEQLRSKRAALARPAKLHHKKSELVERERLLAQDACSGQRMGRIDELDRLRLVLSRTEAAERQAAQGVAEIARMRASVGSGSIPAREVAAHWLSPDGSNAAAFAEALRTALERSRESSKQRAAFADKAQGLRGKLVYPPGDGIYGTVDENFELLDAKHRDAIATILGGRAKFVICENENVAAGLLQTSDRKISCIPLNKIAVYGRTHVRGNGLHALDAIRFDARYEKAFRHIFSNFYIFEDKKEASRCCFEHKVVCVTLDGTVYDPKGTLTGGKLQYRQDVVRLSDVRDFEARAEELARSVLADHEAAQLSSVLERLEKYAGLRETIDSTAGKVQQLEKLCSSQIDIGKELAAVRRDIVEATKEENAAQEVARELGDLDARIAEYERGLEDNRRALVQHERELERLQQRLRDAELRNSAKKTSVRMAESLDLRKKHLISSTVALKSKIAKLREQVGAYEKQQRGAPSAGRSMENAANAPGGDRPSYPDATLEVFASLGVDPAVFSAVPEPLPRERAAALDERIAVLKTQLAAKRIRTTMDPSSFEVLEKNIALARELELKVEQLERDKANIVRSISAFSELGLKENRRTFEHINAALKKFLAYFLKDADIEITAEYEIRVKIGTWKNSLAELSGGQRSLIALCLIFSMLSYRPAPFYIFDEIDAALDLSYTQGIGQIIRSEFRSAQFIVISLKNTMYENANKVFRVYIQDQKPRVAVLK
ncbi:structural maintenance of chromosome 2 [Pancytospora philotis]|nr:structural maintenance of chromosome 2 [Pancytospora philotis]